MDILSEIIMTLVEEALVKSGNKIKTSSRPKPVIRIRLYVFSIFLGIAVSLVSQDIWIALLVCGGFLLEREMFGPDLLDCNSSLYRRWGYVRWFWLPYQKFFRDKFFYSKVPVVREFFQLSYLISILLVLSILAIVILSILGSLTGGLLVVIWAPLSLFFTPTIFLCFCLGFFSGAMIETILLPIVNVFEKRLENQKKKKQTDSLAKRSRRTSSQKPSQNILKLGKTLKALTVSEMDIFDNAVSLSVPGDCALIPIKNLQVTLQWTAAVDLDIHAFFKTKLTAPHGKISNLLVRFLQHNDGEPGSEGHVCFFYKGDKDKASYPWMWLDKDEGVGDRGGNNQENLYVTNLQHLEHVLIAVNIFWKPGAKFSEYDGQVTVKCNCESFEVPLTAAGGGNWCIIAHIDNSRDSRPTLINVNKVQKKEPTIASFLANKQ